MIEKSVRLIEYLIRVASLRTKLYRDINAYEKTLWFSSIPHDRDCYTIAWGRSEEHDQGEWLEVQYRREPETPTLPPLCADWIDYPTLHIKNEVPGLLPSITRQINNPEWYDGSDLPEQISITEHLNNFPDVVRTWQKYIANDWEQWAESHDTWEKVNKVYAALFAIHQEQIRLGEEYELLLALGLLTWKVPTGHRIQRHLLVADAVLEFDARLGKFTVRPHTDGANLRPELDMLDIVQQPLGAEASAKVALVGADDNPWNKGCVEGVLEALVHSIEHQGIYNDTLERKNIEATPYPIVEYAPALILRKRSAKGLTEALKRIKERIENGEEIPGEFADLAEVKKKETGDNPNNGGDGPPSSFEGEVFFPRPSNNEQRQIVHKIQKADGVLVQGPPGTGKSHTIANLISHLLATGNRILVTAKTPRALQVLSGHLPKELRPLCVNLLGSGMEEKDSLASSVGGILRKTTNRDEGLAKTEMENLVVLLGQLREEKVGVNRRLRTIRESERHSQVVADGAYRGTAARIAEAVSKDRDSFEWFTDTVDMNAACMINAHEMRIILGCQRKFTEEWRRELNHVWPELSLKPEEFSDLVVDEKRAISEEQQLLEGTDEYICKLLSKCDPNLIDSLRNSLAVFRDERKRLIALQHSWISDVLRDVSIGNQSTWHGLLRSTTDTFDSITKLIDVADNRELEYPANTRVRILLDDARKLVEHLRNGGNLGWGPIRPKEVKDRLYVLKDVRLDGKTCSTVEDFSTIAEVLHVRIEFEKLWGLWLEMGLRVQGTYAQQLRVLKSHSQALEKALSIQQTIENCRSAVLLCTPLDEPVWVDEIQIDRIIASCHLAQARIRKNIVTESLNNLEASVSLLAAKQNAHQITHTLLQAIRGRNIDSFALCTNKINDLEKDRKHLQLSNEYLSNLRQNLPELSVNMVETCNELYWDERISNLCDAWHWAQARYWLEHYILQEDTPALERRASQIEDEINDVIAKLASLHAWSFCFSHMNEDHRRNMKAWQKNVSKITKSGNGKQDFFHRREAQKNLNNCREAVPAWVMPLHRVWDTVSPEPEMFDVIIVDEASQCGLDALPLVYMAKKILIVGDDKQIGPPAEGVDLTAVTQLINQYLFDFEYKASFNINRSLFDHGELRYSSNNVILREHFRCMPEIIRFSNELCYADTPLIPLKQYGPDRLPPLEHIFVSGYREGKNNRTINRPEADAIVQKIVQQCSDSRYDGKTMGVIVLQGDAQAQLIEAQLLERLGAEQIESRRLVCGNSYSFQGDERDIIFLSLVAATNMRIGPLTKPEDVRRFNVAASRASESMLLFHSVTCDDLSSHDLRRRLLEFFQQTRQQKIAGISREELERRALQDNRSIVKPPTPFDSWFEVDVALELLRRNFHVLSQYDVAGKHIDLVVEGGQVRLAVECDGDYWHGTDDYDADMDRQRQLERCGWQFVRIRESLFYANKDASLNDLWLMLENLNIAPFISPMSHSKSKTVELRNFNQSEEDDFDDEFENSEAESDDDRHSGIHLPTPDSEVGSQRAQDIKSIEIEDAIVSALSKCPNQTCTVNSLTSRVLKELDILTRGKPRNIFEVRVLRACDSLEKKGIVEKYTATNQRIRLIMQ